MALFIIDKRLPEKAKKRLSRFGEIAELATKGITYDAISGHPDIFFCKAKNNIIVAPNIPEEYTDILKKNHIQYLTGSNPVGKKYPRSAVYNAAISDNFLIHRMDITDQAIVNACNLERISVSQGYTRCNLLPLRDSNFITSDYGIYRNLKNKYFNILYVKPDGILLSGFRRGFFGGTCGVHENTVFIAGKLDLFHDGKSAAEFLRSLRYDIIELYDGPLFDCGSILIIEQQKKCLLQQSLNNGLRPLVQ